MVKTRISGFPGKVVWYSNVDLSKIEKPDIFVRFSEKSVFELFGSPTGFLSFFEIPDHFLSRLFVKIQCCGAKENSAKCQKMTLLDVQISTILAPNIHVKHTCGTTLGPYRSP